LPAGDAVQVVPEHAHSAFTRSLLEAATIRPFLTALLTLKRAHIDVTPMPRNVVQDARMPEAA
jgi:hypothetical protein